MQDIFTEVFTEITEFLNEFSWLHDFMTIKIFSSNTIERIPKEWKKWLRDNNFDPMEMMNPPYDNVGCDSLKRFLGKCDALSVGSLLRGRLRSCSFEAVEEELLTLRYFTSLRPEDDHSIQGAAPVVLPALLNRASPKKRHEVERLAVFMRRVNRITHSSQVLDVGSGIGMLDYYLHKRYGYRVIGVEQSPFMVDTSVKLRDKLIGRCAAVQFVALQLRDDDAAEVLQRFRQSRCSCADPHPEEPRRVGSEVAREGRKETRKRSRQEGWGDPGNRRSPVVPNCPEGSPGAPDCPVSSQEVPDWPKVSPGTSNCLQETPGTPDVPEEFPVVPNCPEGSPGAPDCPVSSQEVPDCPKVSPGTSNCLQETPGTPDVPEESPGVPNCPEGSPGAPDCPVSSQEVPDCPKVSPGTSNCLQETPGTPDVPEEFPAAPNCPEGTQGTSDCPKKSPRAPDFPSNPGLAGDDSRTDMVSLHACGDLPPIMAQLFRRNRGFSSMVSLSCCYHKMGLRRGEEGKGGAGFENFPLSGCLGRVARANGFGLNTSGLRLAGEESAAHWLARTNNNNNNIAADVNAIAFRGVLHAVVSANGLQLRKLKRRSAKKTSYSTFEEYVGRALEDHAFTHPDGEAAADPERLAGKMRDTHAALQSEGVLPYVGLVRALQLTLQPVLEALILLDRVAHLREGAGATPHSGLIDLFDPKVSPRSVALFAFRGTPDPL